MDRRESRSGLAASILLATFGVIRVALEQLSRVILPAILIIIGIWLIIRQYLRR